MSYTSAGMWIYSTAIALYWIAYVNILTPRWGYLSYRQSYVASYYYGAQTAQKKHMTD